MKLTYLDKTFLGIVEDFYSENVAVGDTQGDNRKDTQGDTSKLLKEQKQNSSLFIPIFSKIPPREMEEIIEFSMKKNFEFKRKQKKLLYKACENAILYLNQKNAQADEEEDDVNESCGLDHMNNSLTSMYLKSSSTKSSEPAAVNQKAVKSGDATADPDQQQQQVDKKGVKRKEKQEKRELKKQKLDSKYPTPSATLKDLGGLDEVAQELLQLIGMPLLHPEIFIHLGIEPSRGILLQGAPGCGKTMLANAIAGETRVPFLSIAAPTIVSGMSGESEKKIREVFDEAKELAPCILFIDEIDAITPKRETAQREMERRIVAQLLTCMDDVSFEKMDGKAVIIIGATNRPDSLDPALRRAGRFDREITLPVPDQAAREKIISKMAEKLTIDGQVSFKELAKLTPGFVGADLKGLMSEAGMIAVKRIFSLLVSRGVISQNKENDTDNTVDAMQIDQQVVVASTELVAQEKILSFSSILESIPTTLSSSDLEHLSITFQDFVEAIKKVQPSSKREGFASVPGVSWDDIGALSKVREELRMCVVEPIKHPEYFKKVGLTSSMGVLLFGPPGCGKTLLAKAVANESHCNFLSVKGPELINKYVGESERAIRMVFSRAQASAPCVIFFDEIDAICPARSNDAESQSSSRLVNTLLTEMDGMQGRKLVFVIAATNRPDMIDPAMLRPGRLDKSLYVDLPSPQERLSILTTLTRKTPLCSSVDLDRVAHDPRTDGMSGADLASLVREASVNTIRDVYYKGGIDDSVKFRTEAANSSPSVLVRDLDFEKALNTITPSVGEKDRKKYESLRRRF